MVVIATTYEALQAVGDIVQSGEQTPHALGGDGQVHRLEGARDGLANVPVAVSDCMPNVVADYRPVAQKFGALMFQLNSSHEFIINRIGSGLPNSWTFPVCVTAEAPPLVYVRVPHDPSNRWARNGDFLENVSLRPRDEARRGLLRRYTTPGRDPRRYELILPNTLRFPTEWIPESWGFAAMGSEAPEGGEEEFECEHPSGGEDSPPERRVYALTGILDDEKELVCALREWLENVGELSNGQEVSGSAIRKCSRFESEKRIVAALFIRKWAPDSIFHKICEDLFRCVCEFL